MIALGPVEAVTSPGPRRDRAVRAALARHALHGGPAARDAEALVPCGCLTALLASYWLGDAEAPLPGLDDAEGERVASALPPVIDAHVHLFPDRVFEALWSWFEKYGWPIRYRLKAPDVARFLLDRGVEKIVALHYGHRPGMSTSLNAYVAELARAEPRIVPLATVLPGEPGAPEVLREAAANGARGVKLHCHVQGFAPDDESSHEVLATCEALDLPVVIHAGRQPNSAAYAVDAFDVSGAGRVERALDAHPRLRLVVPHFGADEFDAFGRLLDRFENLYLDSTMMLSGYFAAAGDASWLVRAFPERILFGTDFPNLPYAWDRELRSTTQLGLGEPALASLLAENARRFFRL